MIASICHIFRPSIGRRLRFIILNQIKNRSLRHTLHRYQREHPPVGKLERTFANGVAVVMPCYNHARFLEATFASISAQTYRPFQLIVVDDCSTDQSFSVMKVLCSKLPSDIDVVLLQTPMNSGQAAALNLAINATSASVIMTLDADDYLLHDALDVALERLQSEQDIYLLGATSIRLQGDGPPPDGKHLLIRDQCPDYRSAPLIKYNPNDMQRVHDQNDINMSHSGTIFFRSVWEETGGFYTNKFARVVVHTDRDFQLRVGCLVPIATSRVIPFSYYRVGSTVQFGGGDSARLWSGKRFWEGLRRS